MDRVFQDEHGRREAAVNRIEALTDIYFEGQNGRGLYNLEADELFKLLEYVEAAGR